MVRWLRLFFLVGVLTASAVPMMGFAQSPAAPCDLAGYNADARPDPEGTPTDVRIGVFVADIDKVDNLDQSFRTDVFITMEWEDPRLAVIVQAAGSQTCRFPRETVWNPQLVLFNQRSTQSPLPDRVNVDDQGNAIYTQRILGSLRSPFDLRDFPLDHQMLPITIISIEYGPDQVNLQFDTGAPSHDHDFMNAGWILVEENHEVGTLDSTNQDTSAENERFVRFDYMFQVRRELGFYIWRVIGPLSFIVMMSCGVFWIDPGMVGVQIGLASTSILTLVAFLFSLNAFLPPLSYLTRMDVFMFVSLALAFLAFSEAIATAVLKASERERLALSMDRWARWLFPALFAAVHLAVWTT